MAGLPDPESTPPRLLVVVRRNAVDRYAQLREQFDRSEVAVIWDRRVADRRGGRGRIWPAQVERRRDERRRVPPATWESLGFLMGRREG
jgi:hypothetical protein